MATWSHRSVGPSVGLLQDLADKAFSAADVRLCLAVDELCVELCHEVVRELGGVPDSNGVPASSRYLAETVRRITVESPAGDESFAAHMAMARWRWPDEPMLPMLERCRDALPDVIRGRRDGWEVVFPHGDTSLWSEMHAKSRVMAPISWLAGRAAAQCLAEGATVLEVGAGVGAGTAQLILSCHEPAKEYHYTDLSETFSDVAG